jgi:hypothetical protein
MSAILFTFLILALFAALGYPASRLLFVQLDRSRRRADSPAPSLLLAPLTGLALFAIYTGCFSVARQPVAKAFPAFWFLLAGVWVAWLVYTARSPRRQHPPSVHPLKAHAPLWLGLAAIMTAYFMPFMLNPDLVFWHYAGSDGYMYMRISEHVADFGTGVVPAVGPYDAASGFLAEVIHNYQIGSVQDKPAVMSLLGGLAVALGRTTHELFSPVNCAAMAMLYLALFIFGQTLMRLPSWAAAIFALLAGCAPAAWMLHTYTFFGNILALPFYVTLLFLVRPLTAWRTAVGFGVLFGAQMAIFPDGTVALLGIFGTVTPYLLWAAYRHRRLRRFLYAALLAGATTSVVVFMFGLRLWVTALGRLFAMFGGTSRLSSAGHDGFNPLTTIDWIWGALNLNFIPPRPLQPGEQPYLVWLIVLLAAFFVGNLWRHRALQLAWYLVAFALLLLIGWSGFFVSDYELFRGLAVFSYLPIAAIFSLPWLLAPAISSRGRTVWLWVTIMVIAPLLYHFVKVDLYHFRHGIRDHLADAQYTVGDMADRRALARIAQDGPLTIGSEIPSFTAMANTVMLFSNVPLGVPSCFHKFVFFRRKPNDDSCAAPFLVRNLRYQDITEVSHNEPRLHTSANYEVVANDLIPFYDNDTLPMLHGYTIEFIRERKLPLARVYAGATRIAFNSQRPRTVSVVLQLVGHELPPSIGFSFDHGPLQQASVNPEGNLVTLTSAPLSAGVHHLKLEAPSQPLEIVTVWLRETAMGEELPWQRFRTLARRMPLWEADKFSHFNPAPARVFSQHGASLYGDFVALHPISALYFHVPAGNRRLRTTLLINAEAYENLPAGYASDGVELVVAVLTAEGDRTVVLQRKVDPFRVEADRGPLAVDVTFPVPANAEIEVSIHPGPNGNGARDWSSFGPLTID